jgi:hypothetical protein
LVWMINAPQAFMCWRFGPLYQKVRGGYSVRWL